MRIIAYIGIVLIFLSCSEEKGSIVEYEKNDVLELQINESDYNQLETYRNAALKNGVLDNSLKKYVAGTITYHGKKVPVKLRLKGDWVDHLKGEKWSFRIKVSGDNAFLGLKSFSVQSPHTRSFLHEWFIHQVFLKEGVLTTRYEFIPISINGKQMGVYALEEHFDKQLVEAKNRREGPILKFNEEGVWETRVVDPKAYHSLPYFAAAEVVPFKKNRTLKSEALKKHFHTAQNLLLRHKSFDGNIDEIFDIDKLAKFYALTDLANTDHSLIWHNLRFYYNPVSRKLEPIAYDCYPEEVQMSMNLPIFGYNKDKVALPDYSYVHYRLFNNKVFKALYINYLKKYSDTKFLDEAFNEVNYSLNKYGAMLNQEYPNAQFDKDFYYQNIEAIRNLLPEYIDSDITYELQDYKYDDFTNSNTYYYNTGFKAYASPFQDSVTNNVQFYNFHSSSITVIGYGLKQNKDSIILFDAEQTIRPQNNNSKIFKTVLPKKAKTIFFIANNRRLDTMKIAIGKWAFNIKQVSSIKEVLPTNFIKKHPYIESNSLNKLLILKTGNYTFTDDIILPKGWTFIIQKGTQIDLVNNAAIISYSPIHAEGTKSEVIVISSSDSTGQGLVIIDNYGSSMLQNVVFNNLNTLHKYGWFLTGAVTFYQSNVVIENCVFEDNTCEDALNLVQSNFTFTNSTVQRTFSDGLDSDFSTGTISNSIFENTGNDCIDLSGSKVEIRDCKIINSGDKGISGGENSNIEVSNTRINGAKIAIASKDLSTVYVDNPTIENVDYNYVIFRKKPEYGPAKIIVSSKGNSVTENKNLIDKGSVLINKGDTICGQEPINVDSLYVDFN